MAVGVARRVAAQVGHEVAGGGRTVERLQIFPPDHRVDQAVLRGFGPAARPAARRRLPTEGGRRGTPGAPQRAGGQHRDAGRIQAAAQVHAHRMRAVHAVRHRLVADLQQRLGQEVVAAGRPSRRVLGTPPALQARRASLDRQEVTRREATDIAEEGAFTERTRPAGQLRGDGLLVQILGNARRGQHGVDVAREDDAVRRQAVVEGPGPDVVARAEQGPALRVPDREGIVAEQAARAVRAPAPVRPEDEVSIRQERAFGAGDVEGPAQRFTIVETRAGGQRQFGSAVDEGHARRAFVRARPRRPASRGRPTLRRTPSRRRSCGPAAPRAWRREPQPGLPSAYRYRRSCSSLDSNRWKERNVAAAW